MQSEILLLRGQAHRKLNRQSKRQIDPGRGLNELEREVCFVVIFVCILDFHLSHVPIHTHSPFSIIYLAQNALRLRRRDVQCNIVYLYNYLESARLRTIMTSH